MLAEEVEERRLVEWGSKIVLAIAAEGRGVFNESDCRLAGAAVSLLVLPFPNETGVLMLNAAVIESFSQLSFNLQLGDQPPLLFKIAHLNYYHTYWSSKIPFRIPSFL